MKVLFLFSVASVGFLLDNTIGKSFVLDQFILCKVGVLCCHLVAIGVLAARSTGLSRSLRFSTLGAFLIILTKAVFRASLLDFCKWEREFGYLAACSVVG